MIILFNKCNKINVLVKSITVKAKAKGKQQAY